MFEAAKREANRKFLCGILFLAVLLGISGTGNRLQPVGPVTAGGESGSSRNGGNVVLWAAQREEKEMFFTLTKEEEEYLKGLRGRTLRLGVSGQGMWEQQGGVNVGPAAPLADVLCHEFGLDVAVVCGTWEENRAALAEGALDFLFGVPAALAGSQEAEEENSVLRLSETVLYRSAELYERPYVLVEAYGNETAASKQNGSAAETVGYVAGDAVYETLRRHIYDALGALWGGRTFTEDTVIFVPYPDEDTLLAALRSGDAAAAVVSEDALFAQYPAMDFAKAVPLAQYGTGAALGTAKEELFLLLDILNRYLETTQEGDALREAMQVQRQDIRRSKICGREQEILQTLQADGESIRYAQAGLDSVPFFWHTEAGAQGELSDFLAFVSEYTALTFEESGLRGEAAVWALEDGELLFLAGMTERAQERPHLTFGERTLSRLVPVVPTEDAEQFTEEMIARRYWGAVEEVMQLLAGTAFDGHVVGFADEIRLYEAIRTGEIGGAIIGTDTLDAMLLSGEYGYCAVTEYAFYVNRGLIFSGDEAAGLFGRLYSIYRLLQEESGKTAAALYRADYVQVQKEQGGLKREVRVWRILSLLLAAAAAGFGFLLYRTRSELRLERRPLRTRHGAKESVQQRAFPRGKEERSAAAQKDALTGLLTGDSCMEQIKALFSKCPDETAAFAYLDLNAFGSINELYGSDAGDEALISFAECIKTLEQEENTIVFRREGDVFGAFRCHMTSELDYRIFLGELQSLSAQIRVSGNLICLTYRCGAAVTEDNAHSAEELEKHAREAVRCCKERGVNYVQWPEAAARTR